MNTPEFVDAPIKVEAKMSDRQLHPQTVVWQGRKYAVIAIGRQWTAEDGTHVLLEVHDGSRMGGTTGKRSQLAAITSLACNSGCVKEENYSDSGRQIKIRSSLGGLRGSWVPAWRTVTHQENSSLPA